MKQDKPQSLSKHVSSAGAYVFARLAKTVKEIEKSSGKKVLNLGPGIPDIPPSRRYIEKYHELLADPDAHTYPGYAAIPEFADAIMHWYRQRFGVDLSADELLPLNGAKDGISHLPFALLNPGDEVMVPDPGYPAYVAPTRLAGGVSVPYPVGFTDNGELDVGVIEDLISPKTKFMWVNFPSNPTGQTASLADYAKLVAMAEKHGIWIVSDLAYADITFDGYRPPSILQIAGAREVSIEINSLSKTFSFAGFRIGYAVGNSKLISALSQIKSQFDSGMNLPLQRLAAHALTETDWKWHHEMLKDYRNRSISVSKLLKREGLQVMAPKAGLYLWARTQNEICGADFAENLLRKKHILVTPGQSFGAQGKHFVRASYCVDISDIDNY